jgi:hypothetical protein
LTKTCLERKLPVESWRAAESLAMIERGDHLMIYDINRKKAPTLAQITLELSNKKDNSINTSKVVDWIADGIKAQNDQFVVNLMHKLVF